jgi:hypothetical protein
MSAIALVSLALLVALSNLSPVVKAQDNQLFIQLNPASGPAGTPVGVYGLGFSGGTVTISFNSKDVSTANPGMFGRINGIFMVPSVSQGVYTVTATTPAGTMATATFTVTSKASASTPGTGTGTGANTNTGTNTGTTTGAGSPAGTASITLSATQGNVGKAITLKGTGFGAGSFITINFASTYVAAASADSSGNVNVGFTVPMENAGFYTVSASTSQGIYASTTFTVTTGLPGSNQNTGTSNGGFWTGINTLAVGLVVAAAVIVPTTFVYMRRSRREPLIEEEQPVIQPQAPSYTRTPSNTSTYNKPAGIASRYDQFASYNHSTRHGQASKPYTTSSARSTSSLGSYNAISSQAPRRPASPTTYSQPNRSPQPTNTVTCRHCRQTVRADYNICPYCKKKPK